MSSYQGPVTDDHFHLRRDGRCIAAAEDFARAGGTDLVLVHCPDFAAPPTDEAGHRAAYADTIAMAEEVRASVGLGVRVVLGPHPAPSPINSRRGRSTARPAVLAPSKPTPRASMLPWPSLTKGRPTPWARWVALTGRSARTFGTSRTSCWRGPCVEPAARLCASAARRR